MKKRFSHWCLLAILALIVTTLTGCQNKSSTQKGLRIVTSFYPIYAMTKAVSGDLNDVRMIQSGAGIHSFEPSANDVAAIYDADVFIYHSHTLETWAGSLEPSLNKSIVKVLEASKGMTLSKVQGLEDMEVSDGVDPATLYDPHTWTDPQMASKEVERIKKSLIKLDPKNKDTYEKNAKSFKEEAKQLTQKYQKKFKNVSNKVFVTQHTAFSYLANRFGLTQLGISGISPEQEPTPRQLKEIRDFIKQYKVKTVFVEKNVSQKMAKTVAKSTGAKLKTLSPLESDPKNQKTYLENVEENLEILYQELNK
ncbi:metal ABC transporter substrate-binding protein [Streptococcus orisratti]|uniref:metal ABC transporter substrate-binding protein n=1 Tax=Streptococcus orisratti TaxID=114652 RepID=UPI0023F87E0D|nr:metal ABC transporter substrate-binding protein [Streptococcus orisratti]